MGNFEIDFFGFREWFLKKPSNPTQNDRKASSRTKKLTAKKTMQKEPPNPGMLTAQEHDSSFAQP